jgi:Fic family protein
MVLARRELDFLTEIIEQNQPYADLLFHMLNRREAVDSSQIEGTHTSFDGLLIHEINDGTGDAHADPDADVTLGYVRAYSHGACQIDRAGQAVLNRKLILELHGLLMGGNLQTAPGRWRQVQNWIGGFAIETATYVPPPPAEVPRLMADLEQLLQYQPEGPARISILVRAAIAHVQFEAIHPFKDGNGRTGRLLLPLMLKADGEPPIHLATFLKIRKRDYYLALEQAQKRLNWTPWFKLFLECVIASCRHTARLFSALRAIQTRWQETLSAAGKRRDAAVWKVCELLLGQPVVTVNTVAQRLGITFPAANMAIAELTGMGILRQASLAQRRRRVFHAHEVMNALYTGLDDILLEVERQTLAVQA